jgi:hypothetical protein
VVSELCAGEYGAGRIREGRTRGQERVCGLIRSWCRRGSTGKRGQGYTRRIRLTLSLRVGSYGLDLSDDPPIKWRGLSPVRFSGCTM